ncbi:hypothetical protein F5146DRAFT_1003385 [Armillaria mellea]|nr:hypothetical protein F5146DRAFT_1003385 [Armillaria mellea]
MSEVQELFFFYWVIKDFIQYSNRKSLSLDVLQLWIDAKEEKEDSRVTLPEHAAKIAKQRMIAGLILQDVIKHPRLVLVHCSLNIYIINDWFNTICNDESLTLTVQASAKDEMYDCGEDCIEDNLLFDRNFYQFTDPLVDFHVLDQQDEKSDTKTKSMTCSNKKKETKQKSGTKDIKKKKKNADQNNKVDRYFLYACSSAATAAQRTQLKQKLAAPALKCRQPKPSNKVIVTAKAKSTSAAAIWSTQPIVTFLRRANSPFIGIGAYLSGILLHNSETADDAEYYESLTLHGESYILV